MKNVILAFTAHRDLYTLSISLGAIFSTVATFFVKYTPDYIFGVNISLWTIALVINLIDIRTGIKADVKRKADLGLNFRFESGKGWRALEKVFVFTMIIWFIYDLEIEAVRLETFHFLTSILLYLKFIMIIYVVLIELQSIGENEEVRFGMKGKMFTLLDKTVDIINQGIFKKLKTSLGV